jgi:hypothetical protein
MMVNSSTAPAAVVAGDHVRVTLVGVASGSSGFRVTIEDGAGAVYNAMPGEGYITWAGANYDFDVALSTRDPIFERYVPIGYGGGPGTTPATYHARLYFLSASTTIQLDVPFTINNFVPYPFPLMNGQINPNGTPLLFVGLGVAAGGTILAGSAGACPAVRGNISLGVFITYATASLSPQPTNITLQFYAVDGSLTYHALGTPAFGSPPSVTSFDTTTLTDGSYVLFGKIVDISDTSGNHWVAANFGIVGAPFIIQNGGSPMNPAGDYMIPAAFSQYPAKRMGSGTPDAIPYNGVPVAATAVPYPSDASVGTYLLPVFNPSSPFYSSPASARVPPLGFWWQGVDGIKSNEYKPCMQFSATNAGGIFCNAFVGKTTGSENIEGAYQAVAGGSYRDGPRNSNQTTNFTTLVASPATGPWGAYHWTFIQEDGRLGVMDLTGAKLTIAGYRRDLTQLSVDWLDSTQNAEFPNSVQVGTIDTNPKYIFGDFGGAAADCCWDPRDPFICYVSQTIDHCIIKINFHTQTLNSVNYSASNPLCQRYAGYKGGLMGDGVGGYANGPALGTVTGGMQNSDGAQFNGVYSICMQKRTDVSDPQGTMYVADNYNGLIRVISAAAIDSNGNFTGAGPTVTTLVGTHGGSVPPSPSIGTVLAFTTISVTSLTSNGDGTASVVLGSASVVASIGWKVTIQVGGSNYLGGGSTYENNTFGIYTVSAFTSNTHFSITMATVPSSGVITANVYAADTYSSPLSVSFSSAYTMYPQTVRVSSAGDIILGEAWYNQTIRRIWLTGINAGTITRIGRFGDLSQASGTGFGWQDVDDVGACGPVDDIVLFKSDANPGSASVAWRLSIDGSVSESWFGDAGPDFPSEGPGGVGHYPWAFVFSKTAFRMLAMGLDPTGWLQFRARVSADPDQSADAIGGIGSPIGVYLPYLWLDAGWVMWQQGSRGILPFGFRPSITAIMGANGLHFYGAGTGPTLDDLPALHSSNASLAAYIQGGFFGSVPRPEFSFDDDGTTPGRALAALMYFIRRQALSGSWPTQQAGLFAYQNPGDGSGQLVAAGQWSLNYIRPQITIHSGDPTRASATSIRVRWTTDKNTLGIVIAGTPNSNVASPFGSLLYNFWTTLEMDNAAAWGTAHDVTITGLPANNVTPPFGSNAPNNVAVLVIDRAGNWNLTSNFSVA